MNGYYYTTDKYGEMRKDRLATIPHPMSGYCTIEMSDQGKDNEFGGFGVAITAASCYNLNKMEPKERKEFLQGIYGKDGLNLCMARLPFGSCDYSKDVYTYDDVVEDRELKHFSIERDKEYIIPIIKEIIEINPDIFFFASPWSPPGWMKTGGAICGGYFIDEYAEIYSNYLKKAIEAYRNEGINIRAITIQNEPDVDQQGQFPACVIHPETEAKIAMFLGKRLKEANIDVKIWIYDHNYDRWPRVKWQFDRYPELRELIDNVSFHYYGKAFEMVKPLFDAYPNLKWHLTEGGPRLLENYDCDYIKWSEIIIKALNDGCRSITGWNLMLDQTGGPNVGHCYCGGFVTRNSVTGELSVSGQYKAYKHFSKYVTANSRIKSAKVLEDETEFATYSTLDWRKLRVIGIDNPDNQHIVAIVNPSTDCKRQMQYFYNNQWWYFEVLPQSITTVIFEQ